MGRRRAKERRSGEQKDADIGRVQADQKGGEREGGDGETQDSHGARVFRIGKRWKAIDFPIRTIRPDRAKEGCDRDFDVKSS
jgi:hypothetical protein